MTANSIFGKISFRNEEEIKTFIGEKKVREFVTSRSAIKEWLKKLSKQIGYNRRRLGILEGKRKSEWMKSG